MKIPFLDLYLVKGEFLREQNELIKNLNETITIGEKVILDLSNTCELRNRIIFRLLGKKRIVKDDKTSGKR